jgi:hypothetical protein
MVERVDPARLRLGVLVDDQFHTALGRHAVAKFVHRPKLPRRIDVQQRKRRRRRIKGFPRQMQHHRAVLADAVQHHRGGRVGHHLAHDVNALRLQAVQMRHIARHGDAHCRRAGRQASSMGFSA